MNNADIIARRSRSNLKNRLHRLNLGALRLQRIVFSVCICVFYLFSSVFPAFKNLGWSTSAAGMGGVFCAISDDSSGIFYNPAGSAFMDYSDLDLMYVKPYIGLKDVDLGLMSVSYIHPVKNIGTFGLGLNDYGNGLYKENTAILSYSGKVFIGDEFKSQKVTRADEKKHLLLEVLKRKKEKTYSNLSLGINCKFLTHRYNWDSDTIKRAQEYGDPVILAGSSKSAFTGDFGFLYNFKKFYFGAAGLNLTQPDVGLYFEDRVPMDLRSGVAYKFKNAIVGMDVSYRNQEWGSEMDKTNLHLGAEHWFSEKKFGLRLGGNRNEASFGSSFRQKIGSLFLGFDYAFLWSFNIGDNFGTHRLSISLSSIIEKKETVVSENEKKTKKELSPGKVDINTASEEELIKVGFNTIQARMIIRHRGMKPFKETKELPKRVKEIPKEIYLKLEDKITVE